MKPLIRCGFGLGNRVATLANALSRDTEIRFVWRNNFHLPMDHSQVFPAGIPGVEFVDAPPGMATRWERNIAGHSWDGAQDRHKANAAYGAIMEAMVGEPSEPVDVAVLARFFRFPQTSCNELAELAATHGKRVFLMADSRRLELAAALTGCGVESFLPTSPEMTHDKDRTADSVLRYIADWKRALAARVIITSHELSSSIFPAMASGKTIVFPT